MAATSRTSGASLEEALASKGHEFSFFQAIRLLRMLAEREGDGVEAQKLRIRPELGLAFPSADLGGVGKEPDGYAVRATFLGLYGHSSPLPTFYTEQLRDLCSTDISGAKELLDILNHRLYTLFHDCHAKHRLFFQVAQQEREEYLERLFSLIGLGDATSRGEGEERATLLRYLGILTQKSRSAAGLATVLSDLLSAPVKISQCVQRKVAIPPEKRLQLGAVAATVGVDALLGREVTDARAKFRVQIGPLDWESFSALLPGTPGRARLDALVECYLNDPLVWDVELLRGEGKIPAATLGIGMGGQLGCDSWLAPAENSTQASVVFNSRGS